jgi:hypothetical protein
MQPYRAANGQTDGAATLGTQLGATGYLWTESLRVLRRRGAAAVALLGPHLADVLVGESGWKSFLIREIEIFREVRLPSVCLRSRSLPSDRLQNRDQQHRRAVAQPRCTRRDVTPAYDLSPMNRSGKTMMQAIAYGTSGERQSNFAALLGACHESWRAVPAAQTIMGGVIAAVRDGWKTPPTLRGSPRSIRACCRVGLSLT